MVQDDSPMATLAHPRGPMRPKRFLVELPIEYRLRTWARWHSGHTENISCNGVLFQAGQTLEPFSPIEFRLRLPQALTGPGEVVLLCAGYVVRQVGEEHHRPRVAAAFVGYEVANGKPGEDQLREAYRRLFRREVAGLSHKMNNLLAIMMGNAELMLETGRDPKVYAERIRDAAQQASEFMRDFARKMTA